MNTFNKVIQKIHKYSGLIIALFFIMWFVSGIILLYHKYPKVSRQEIYAHQESLASEGLPSIYDIPGMTDTTKVRTLSVGNYLGQVVWTISEENSKRENHMAAKASPAGNRYVLADDTLIAINNITSAQLDSIACRWAGCNKIIKIDTLDHRQQWILYERFEKSLPILRYYFDNPEKSEIFISEKDGDVVQISTRSQRIWAWLGAIPHKFYFNGIRTDTQRWKTVITIGGLLCLIASLSGMYIGIYYIFVGRKKRNLSFSPFKKRIWRYHHYAGLIFGIFLIGWGISGALSTQRIPKWMVNYNGDYSVSTSGFWGKKPLKLCDYKLDYRDVLTKYPNVKSIAWHHFGSMPAYLVVSGTKEIYVDASQEENVSPLAISKEEIESAVQKYFGDNCKYSIREMKEYDEYYLSPKGQYPLPVWKIEIEDGDGSRLYVSPTDGYLKYVNKNRMVKKWIFSAAHYLDIKYFMLHGNLRHFCLWILSIGCVFVIITGVAIYFTKGKIKYRNR